MREFNIQYLESRLTTHNLEVQSHCEVKLWLAFEKAIQFPASIESQEISQQRTSYTKSISSCKRTDSSSFYFYSHWIARLTIKDSGTLDLIECTIPCCAKIKKLY